MFSTLRNRFDIPGVISVIALVFAMFGGAYAASNSSGGGKATASAKAKQGPRGKTGKTGPAGPQGPAGPAGAKGDAGAAGSNGSNGAPGKDGTSVQGKAIAGGVCGTGVAGVEYTSASGTNTVCNGKNGTTGFTETLPSEKTETGTWGARTAGAQTVYIPISFALPVDPAPTMVYVANEENKTAEGCPGIAPNGLPMADPGKLCVYVGVAVNAPAPTSFTIEEEQEGGAGNGNKSTPFGVGPAGTVLNFTCASICYANGAWAVTAE